jgi:hypothetical protein
MNGILLRDEAGPPADGVFIQESIVGAKAFSSREKPNPSSGNFFLKSSPAV